MCIITRANCAAWIVVIPTCMGCRTLCKWMLATNLVGLCPRITQLIVQWLVCYVWCFYVFLLLLLLSLFAKCKWFLRTIAECFMLFSRGLGVCLSVCPSVTLMSCIKMVQARITKSSLSVAPKTLVYRDKISCPWMRGSPSNESVKKVPPKKTLFCRYWLV